MDLLGSIQEKSKAVTQMTLTTWDDRLCRIIEPEVCVTSRRLEVLRTMKEAGIPTVVWMTPLLPFINDTKENLEGIQEGCLEAGVRGFFVSGWG